MQPKQKTPKPKKVVVQKKVKRKLTNNHIIVEAYNLRSTSLIAQMPDELLLKIFSYLPQKDLFSTVRLVCKKWNKVSATPSLWKEIDEQGEAPTEVLVSWVKSSPHLQHISLSNRNDVNTIINEISKTSKVLKSITINNCWGSRSSLSIKWKSLCNLVKRCQNLQDYNFKDVKFRSCKFFTLLANRLRSGKVKKRFTYCGPINCKQMKALLRAVTIDDNVITATILNQNVQQKVSLNDVIQYFQENQDSSVLDEVWQNFIMEQDDACQR